MDRVTSMAVFAQVVESGGFAAAARRLRMSTTMVSSHVQALESRLGARLLNRTTRRVSVTDTGAAYYQRCTQILGELEEADRLAGAMHASVLGTLRLHLSAAMVRFVAPVIEEFLALHAGVSIDLTVGDRRVDMVEEGFDLVIHPSPPPDSSLIVRQLTPWRHILCCAPAYLETHDAPRRLADLADHNCLQYAFYPFGNAWRFTSPAGKPVSVRVSGNLISNSPEMLRTAALHARGVFLAPSFVVADDMSSGDLRPLLEDHVPVEFAINAVYPHRHHLSTKVRRFLDLVAARFADHRTLLNPARGVRTVGDRPASA
ncbi:MAG: LysR family transcriptional regulator [Pseudomonadota bacterium]